MRRPCRFGWEQKSSLFCEGRKTPAVPSVPQQWSSGLWAVPEVRAQASFLVMAIRDLTLVIRALRALEEEQGGLFPSVCSLPHILRGLEAACRPKAAPLQRDPRQPWLSTHPWPTARLALMWKRHKRAWQKVKVGSNLHNCLDFECIPLTYTQIHRRRVEGLLVKKCGHNL